MKKASSNGHGVHYVTKRAVSRSMKKTLERVGHSYEELAEQARTGRFTSERARLAWSVVKDSKA